MPQTLLVVVSGQLPFSTWNTWSCFATDGWTSLPEGMCVFTFAPAGSWLVFTFGSSDCAFSWFSTAPIARA